MNTNDSGAGLWRKLAGLLMLLLTASRWRFWPYLAGPFLLGYTAGAARTSSLMSGEFWAMLGVFLLPANLLLYGVNDLCDRDTDRFNPKKGTVELSLQQPQERTLLVAVLVSGAVLLLATLWMGLPLARWLMLAFLALSIAYSAPPLRLKSRAFLDSASNILYVVPGLVGYALSAGRLAPWQAIAAGGLWTAAMHLYSAIPDIESDRRSGLVTSATVLGTRGALVACALLWAESASIATALRMLWPWCLLAWIYPLVPLMLLGRPRSDIGRMYWSFPLLNSSMGMLAFFLIAGGRL